jgi:hypothetical protein
MVRKKLDERVRTLIERGVVKNERSILVLVGDHGKDQVPNIHQLLTKTSVRARPKVLWCYKKELGFSTHRMKVSLNHIALHRLELFCISSFGCSFIHLTISDLTHSFLNAFDRG